MSRTDHTLVTKWEGPGTSSGGKQVYMGVYWWRMYVEKPIYLWNWLQSPRWLLPQVAQPHWSFVSLASHLYTTHWIGLTQLTEQHTFFRVGQWKMLALHPAPIFPSISPKLNLLLDCGLMLCCFQLASILLCKTVAKCGPAAHSLCAKKKTVHKWGGPSAALGSVATAKADVFRKNGINMGSKFAKIMKILDKIDDVKSQGVI